MLFFTDYFGLFGSETKNLIRLISYLSTEFGFGLLNAHALIIFFKFLYLKDFLGNVSKEKQLFSIQCVKFSISFSLSLSFSFFYFLDSLSIAYSRHNLSRWTWSDRFIIRLYYSKSKNDRHFVVINIIMCYFLCVTNVNWFATDNSLDNVSKESIRRLIKCK